MRLGLILLGYLSGCVPWGLVLARRAGVDVRRAGSGNIGATNVARTAGFGLGLATLAADTLKGALPTVLAGRLTEPATTAATGLAAVLGHVFPLPLRFVGGKGVATALGVLVVLCPLAAGCAAGVFALAFALGRYVSVASVLAALAAPLAVALLAYPPPTLAATLLMTAVIVLRHRENLRRLRFGSEPRFGVHNGQAAPEK